MLLDQKRYAGNQDGDGAGCIWGQMILMRVYENQENMTMQTILREALEKLGLAKQEGIRAFSVLSDISNTVIADAIEPYFMEHDLRRAVDGDRRLWGFDSKGQVTELASKRTLAQTLAAKRASYQKDTARGIRAPKAELGYEDLHNLPMLLIVTEKARMGDTFPHSLASLDLRMRTGGTLVAFVQELGRMCRYPSTRILQRGITREQLIKGHYNEEVKQSFEAKLPMMLVLANKDDRDIVCHVQWDPSEPASELHNDWHFKDLSPDVTYDVHGYFDRLPRAIIRKEVQKMLVDGIAIKESKAPNSRTTSALQCVNMKDGLDAYMAHARGKSDKALLDGIDDHHNPLHAYHDSYVPKLVTKRQDKETAAPAADENDEDVNDTNDNVSKTPHYDAKPHDASDKHSRRMLLFAECQIGKTGAYLHYLRRLREDIRGTFVPEIISGPIDRRLSWHFPYWRKLAGSAKLDYSQPKEGHYYEKVAKQRLAFLQELAKAQLSGNAHWSTIYCNWLRKAEVQLTINSESSHYKKKISGELIVSKVGVAKIESLGKELQSADIPVARTGEVKQDNEAIKVLKACIDWDRRMTNLSALHEQLADLQQPGYNAANAVWDKPAQQTGPAKKVNCSTTQAQQMMALRVPPSTSSVPGLSYSEHLHVKLPKQDYGCGTSLLSDADYSLYIPSSMRDRVSVVNNCATVADSNGLVVHRWIFTCSCMQASHLQAS